MCSPASRQTNKHTLLDGSNKAVLLTRAACVSHKCYNPDSTLQQCPSPRCAHKQRSKQVDPDLFILQGVIFLLLIADADKKYVTLTAIKKNKKKQIEFKILCHNYSNGQKIEIKSTKTEICYSNFKSAYLVTSRVRKHCLH